MTLKSRGLTPKQLLTYHSIQDKINTKKNQFIIGLEKMKFVFLKIKKAFLIGVGWLSLIIGIVGIFTPILPTVPFLLLSALAFSKGSPRIHNWLLQHPRLGPPIKDWEQNKIIRPNAKKKATILILISWSISAAILLDRWPLVVFISCLLGSALIFIWTRASQ